MLRKLSHRSTIGTALREQRRLKRLTQAALSQRAGLGISAVWTLELGQGRVGTLMLVLPSLGLGLRGRMLTAGPTGPMVAITITGSTPSMGLA